MRHRTVTAPAKINLSLDVVGKRTDGYHLLETVMQSLDLQDQVTVSVKQTDGQGHIRIRSTDASLPLDASNTAYRAAFLFFQAPKNKTLKPHTVDLFLEKKIPVAAGLAGGSADAAAVLLGLNACFDGRLSRRDLEELAVAIGADVPFTLNGGTVYCQGIGEQLTPLRPWPDLAVVLCCPKLHVLTRSVFAAYAQRPPLRRPDTPAVLSAIQSQDLKGLAAATANVLEPVCMSLEAGLAVHKARLSRLGAELVQMSGSGPTLFALFASMEAASQALQALQQQNDGSVHLFLCRTTADGPRILAS